MSFASNLAQKCETHLQVLVSKSWFRDIFTISVRHIRLALVAQILTGLIGFLMNLFLMRKLTTSDFGLFSLFNSSLMLLSSFFHFGWVDTYVHFGSKLKETTDFNSFQKFVFKKILISIFVATLLSWLLAPAIIKFLFNRSESPDFYYYGLLGAVIGTFSVFIISDLRVQSDYKSQILVNAGGHALRAFGIILLVYFGFFDLKNLFLIYTLVPIPILIYLYKKKKILHNFFAKLNAFHPIQEGVSKEKILNYNHWIFFNIVTFILMGNVDSLIISHYHANTSVAQFAATGRLTLPFLYIITAINLVLFPRLSASHSEVEIRRILKKLSYFFSPIVFVMIAFIFFGSEVLLSAAGKNYSDSIFLMKIQLTTALLSILWQPLAVIVQATGHSKSIAILSFIQFLISIALNFLLIPKFAGVGAVITSIVINIFGLIWSASHVFYIVKKKVET